MTKAQQMLAIAGLPDTKQGRAAFHKMYPTPDDFFKVHGDIFKDAPKFIPVELPITPKNVVLKYSPDADYYLENTPADTPESDDDTSMYKSGGGIHIKPSKRGTFTAAAKKHGKSVQGFASQVLANKENYSPAMVKKANFARNAAKWKHEDGGPVMYAEGGKLPEGILRSRLEAHMSPSEAQSYIDSYAQGGTVDALQLMGMPTPRMFGEGSFTGNPYNRFGRRGRNTGDDHITGFSTGFVNDYNLPQGYSSSGQSANVSQAATPKIGIGTRINGLDYTKDFYNDNNISLGGGLSLGRAQQDRGSLFKTFNYTTPHGTPGIGFTQVAGPESKTFMIGDLHGNVDAHVPLFNASWGAQRQGHRNVGPGNVEVAGLNASLEGGLSKFGSGKINPYYDASVGLGMLNNMFNINAGYTNRTGNLQVGLPGGSTAVDTQKGRPYIDVGAQAPLWIDNKGNTRLKLFGGWGSGPQDAGYAGATYTFANGGHITDYSPSYNFGHVQSANNTYRHGYGYGGPIGKYDFGSTIKTIGAAAYGAGEGLLDTVTMGATDQLTDAGYDALQKAGGSSEAEKHKQNAWHGGFQTAGAVTGAVLNPASLGSAITEGSEGVGEVIGEASPNSEKAQKWRQGITQVGGLAGMATGMGAFGTPGGSAAGLTKTQNFYNTGLGNFAGKTSKIGQGFNAVSSGNPMAMLGAFGGMGGMGGGSNMGTTGTSNFSPDPNQYMNQGINFNYSSPSFGHAMGGAVNAPNMMQYADGGLLGMGGINKFSNMFADGGFLNKAGTAGIMGLGPALLAGKMADGGLLGLGGVNKFSGLFGDGGFLGTMIPLAKPFMADGGNTPATEINVERGELLVNKDGKILTEYRGGGMVPHPSDGSMDERGTVPAQEGQFVITKKLAPNYKSAMENNDRLYAEAMRNNISFDKQRKEAKEQEQQARAQQMMMAKFGGMVGQYGYGGGVMKYDGGSGVNFSNPYGLWNNSMPAGIQPGMQAVQNANQGLPGFDLQNFLNLNGLEGADLNPESVRFMMNNQNLNNRQPTNPIFGPGYNDPNANEYTGLDQLSDNPDQIPYRQDLGDKWGYTPNNNYGTSQFVPHYLPTMPSGADRAMDAATQDLVGLPSQKDLNLNNELKPIGPKPPIGNPKITIGDWLGMHKQDIQSIGGRALQYAPALYNIGRGLFEKADKVNPQDYMIKNRINAYEEQYRPDYRPYNAALYSMKTNPNLAARTELFNTAQQGYADQKYKVNQANLARKMQADQANATIDQFNANARWQGDIWNKQALAKKRDFIGKGFEQGSLAYQDERNAFLYGNSLKDLTANYDYVNGRWVPKTNTDK